MLSSDQERAKLHDMTTRHQCSKPIPVLIGELNRQLRGWTNSGNGGIYPCYLCNWLRREGLASKDCMSFRCDLLDAAVAKEVLQALQPAELELALAALQELEARDQIIWRQWQMRLERGADESPLAEP